MHACIKWMEHVRQVKNAFMQRIKNLENECMQRIKSACMQRIKNACIQKTKNVYIQGIEYACRQKTGKENTYNFLLFFLNTRTAY